MRISNKWTALFLSASAVVLSLSTWFSATAILPELRASLGMSPAGATWLTNAVQAGFVVGALASSLLSLSDIMPITRLMAWAQRSCGRFQRGCSAGTRSSVCHCRAICHRRGVGACLPTIGEVRFNMVQAGKRPCLRGHGGGSRAGIGPALSDARHWRRTQLATGSCWKLRCLLDRRPTVRVRPQRGAASVFAHKG